MKKRNVKGIYAKQCFCDKNMTLGGSAIGENVADWARVSTREVCAEWFQEGHHGRRLASYHPDRRANVIGKQIPLFAPIVLRDM